MIHPSIIGHDLADRSAERHLGAPPDRARAAVPVRPVESVPAGHAMLDRHESDLARASVPSVWPNDGILYGPRTLATPLSWLKSFMSEERREWSDGLVRLT